MSLSLALVHSFYSSDQPSGENAQVEAEVEALRRSGLRVKLFAARTDDLESEPMYRTRAAVRVATGRGASPRHEIEAFAPDVVHIHNLFPNLSRSWVRRLSAPLVVTLHNFRFCCANGVLFRDERVCTDCPDRNPWSGLRHRCYRGSASATMPLTLAQLGGPTADPVLTRADRILCLSARQRQLLQARGMPSARLVDWANFLPAHLEPTSGRTMGQRSGAICVGRLSREKGVLDLVNAWESDSKLTVIGDGPQLDDVKSAAVGRNVEVLGRVERSVVLEMMTRTAALIMPGRWPEVAPLTYIEALASGLPVVVHTSSDVSTKVTEEGTGQVIRSMNEAARATAQAQADRGLSAHCRSIYEARYTEEKWRTRMMDLYGKVMHSATTL